MLKKLTLALLLGSVIAQPIMAVDLDTTKLATCMQGAKIVDGEMFVKCIEAAKIPELKGFAKAASVFNNNATAFIVGAALLSMAYCYFVIWPDVAVDAGFNIRYKKNSHAELHAAANANRR